jgi:hypothetical protein
MAPDASPTAWVERAGTAIFSFVFDPGRNGKNPVRDWVSSRIENGKGRISAYTLSTMQAGQGSEIRQTPCRD